MDLIKIMMAFGGIVLVIISAFFWLGFPFAMLLLVTGKRNKQQTKLPTFSLSSVPAILDSRTVYEFIQTLPNQEKAAAYNEIMSKLRKLLLDIKRHRKEYPEDIEDLKQFVMSQVKFTIQKSPASQAMETSKFRDLAELYCLTEVMQDIYMADCKASRTKLPTLPKEML